MILEISLKPREKGSLFAFHLLRQRLALGGFSIFPSLWFRRDGANFPPKNENQRN